MPVLNNVNISFSEKIIFSYKTFILQVTPLIRVMFLIIIEAILE